MAYWFERLLVFVIESCGRKVVWTSHECVTTIAQGQPAKSPML